MSATGRPVKRSNPFDSLISAFSSFTTIMRSVIVNLEYPMHSSFGDRFMSVEGVDPALVPSVKRAVNCSVNAEVRVAIRATRKWGRMVIDGEGGTVTLNPPPSPIHDQKTIYGSGVTSSWLMEELIEHLVRWNLHPETIITHRFTLEQADEAHQLMAEGRCGKVAVCPNPE